LRPFELNEDFNFQKSYSLDPFPLQPAETTIKKRITENFRKRKHTNGDNTDDYGDQLKKIDCNGTITTSSSRIQRSDHVPLLVNTKRWHSLETVRADAEHEESTGCEELIDSNKKSLGRNILKSLVGIFHGSSNAKNSTQNGSSGLLQQQQTSAINRKTAAADQKDQSISMSIV
jgi:hypothetical protein